MCVFLHACVRAYMCVHVRACVCVRGFTYMEPASVLVCLCEVSSTVFLL